MAEKDLRFEIKKMIVETLRIVDVDPRRIGDEEMLFESDLLELDSLDGLELVMAIQQNFGVAITEQSHAVTILRTVNSIALFIESQKEYTTG